MVVRRPHRQDLAQRPQLVLAPVVKGVEAVVAKTTQHTSVVSVMVEDDFTLRFESSPETFCDIHCWKLRLCSSSFTSHRARIHMQMERVLKYISRGFRW